MDLNSRLNRIGFEMRAGYGYKHAEMTAICGCSCCGSIAYQPVGLIGGGAR
jgi:hypothetical protein